MEHSDLIQAAEKAIDAVFGDRSVPAATTLESLGGLRDHIDSSMDALREDLERDGDGT